MTPISHPEMLPVGTELVYMGSDGGWHYAVVVQRKANGLVVDTPGGNRLASFSSLIDPDQWRHYR